jgi:hypothetical protein
MERESLTNRTQTLPLSPVSLLLSSSNPAQLTVLGLCMACWNPAIIGPKPWA